MSIINFSRANCRNCYKCVRECPVKAVKVKNEQAEIVESMCIGCGQCLRVCPQNAKEVQSELEVVKNYIKSKEKTAVSLAPSFAAAFDCQDALQFVKALRELGFDYVEETSVGAFQVSKMYNEYYNADDENNYITTSCAATNFLIQKYYPALIDMMIPVITPMACHSKMMKKKYGEDTKVVFIGPCLSKKMEAHDEASVDAVLTFDEISKWLEDRKIDLLNLEPCNFDNTYEEAARFYPITGGIARTLSGDSKKEIFKVDGIEECLNFLDALGKEEVTNSFVEINLCRNSCANGPAMPENKLNEFIRRIKVRKYATESEERSINNGEVAKAHVNLEPSELRKDFADLSVPMKKPEYAEIKRILQSLGKNSIADELNCGACGYNSCRDKAVAVYNGMAEKNMCVPHMRQRAETLSNIIFDITPNIIIIVNEELEITEFNPAAEGFFRVKRSFANGKPVSILLDDEDLINSQKSQQDIISKRVELKEYDAVMLRTILNINDQNILVIIMNDITNEERKEEKLNKVKINTIEMAQQVIDKQMMVAQEIASLLGETTAETKMILTRLKKVVGEKEVDMK